MKRQHPMHGRAARQTGLSLVELIVAMVIGLTVVGAALAMYISSGYSSRGGSAMSQMTEDANIALSLLRTQVAMAGYAQPTGVTATGLTTRFTGMAIFGCTGGPTSTVTDDFEAMTCADKDSLPDSVVVRYEVDAHNTVVSSDSKPTDCVNAEVEEDASGLAIVENRYYLSGTTLNCKGKKGLVPQPLVENVVDMKITYGVADTAESGSAELTNHVANRYLTAMDVSGEKKQASPLWNQVTSARICIVIRSDTPVLDQPTGYQGCSGPVEPPAGSTDKFLYRAFTTTVVLQNRIL